MAPEVPISDVLCDAMDYLSKLGANLRTRSDNLKQKRISKDKLKNSHAVQKAASKVLLICELSKKSLDNVEAGVRQVLSLLEASQAPIGGKNFEDSNRESKHKYHYFDYKSRKLRIAKKIPLKHFMSAKVLTRRMSIQDKHPVYYDCKLKRQRRRTAEILKLKMQRNSSADNSDHDRGSVKLSEGIHEQPNNMERGENLDKCTEKPFGIDQKSLRPTNDSIESICSHEQKEVCMVSSINQCKDKTRDKHKDGNDSDTSVSTSLKEITSTSKDIDLFKNNCEKDLSNKLKKINQKTHRKSDKENTASKKSNKIKVSDIYSSDSSDESNKSKSNQNVNQDTIIATNTNNKDDCVSDSSKLEPKAKKLKLTDFDNSNCHLDSGSDKPNLSKQIFDQDFPSKHDSDNDSTVSKQGSQNESGGESRPFIRCVNLSKLLKPNLVSNNKSPKKTKTKKKNSDDEYWAKKRKEVCAFKPKTFSVNIERLPNLTIQFLLRNKLKKITRAHNVICEVKNESETPNTKKMKAFKNALLYDSESDECGETHEELNAKKALFIEPDKNEKGIVQSEYNVSKLADLANSEKMKEKPTKGKTGENKKHSDTENRTTNETHGLNEIEDRNCDVELNESDKETPTKCNQRVKSSLLKDSSDEDAIGPSVLNEKSKKHDQSANEKQPEDSPKIHQKMKPVLLNDLLEDAFAGFSGNDKSSETPTPMETNDGKENNEDHNSNDECVVQTTVNQTETPTKISEKAKSSLLNDSSEDLFAGFNKEDMEVPTNEKIKSSLLKDSSDENSNINEDQLPTNDNRKEVQSTKANNNTNEVHSPTTANEIIKTRLLNDSSDVESDLSDDQKEKQKTPNAKRKHARKCREAKKKLDFSSNSDSEEEKPRHKRKGKKIRNSRSSSSDEVKKSNKKKKTPKIYSDSSDSDDNKTITQVDGAVDENSNSSLDKMVRSKAKPSGSSSQNSDNQDASDKDIDGLTNLSNLNKTRRREPSTRIRQAMKINRSKLTPIIGEELLKSESSSDVSDAGEQEIVQDLPAIALSGLNGDHLAKDDLLGDSDSSVSNNDNDQSENPDNSEDEENVKSKRRKAIAISSDSEGGSNRRKHKDDDVRISDFEDSEEESSEPGKKTKRKKKASDSDASGDSSDGGKKKRRRIKVVNDSDASGSDTENEGQNKHGRKNIRKVMGKNQLEEATKKAAREEKERIARITERQKLYNNLDFDESGKPDEVVLEKVVLDFDPETKEPLIQVDRGLVKKLKPHQANGIKFMWEACFESVKQIKKDKGSGCILAHCMGLGKTLQVISLTHTLLTHSDLTGVNRVLVVCPLSTVLNWVNEIRMWLKHAESEFEVDVYELSRYKQNSERAYQLQQWFDGGGVCVLGYEMFRNLSADNNKKFKKKMLKSFQESLVEPGPDLVVCDEGHLLKNEKTSLSQSMNRIKTRRRIVLTGTPLQNNLKEYYCMVQFVKPNLLGKYNEYLNRFVNPITNGQYTDSTEHDIRVMKRRSHVLHKMLDGAVQRRDYGVLAPFLPPKHEYVLFITLTDVQVKLYQFYLDNYSRRPLAGKSSGFLFPDFQSLQRIWTHPLVLKYNSERYEIMQQKKREREEEDDSEGSLVDFINDDSTPEESTTEESTDDSSDLSDDSQKKSKKKKSAKKGKGKDSKGSARRGTRANPIEVEDEDNVAVEIVEEKNENPTEWWIKLVEESEIEDMRNSHKLVLLFDILRQCEAIGDKLLVFSQSLYSLDLIEHFLGKVDEATQEGRIDEKLAGHVGSWSPGIDYFRLDGSTSCENRSIWCKNFNREDNPRARLFLISTRAGGLGINLVAANRVVIFDVSWNPSHDVQSIFRVYRFGQKKPCYVYRFLAMGTMEEKIYERQVTKQAISKRVIDEQQIDRHYAENDLAELYKFEARPDEPRPLPTLPKDRLFAEMLKEHEAQIYKYHEHDSLLENKEEETLSEEERKAAWEDFENEKTRPPPAPFPSPWPMHNGMMPGLLAQQQQQLAYAALAAMLRKDMPNINDNQIRDMLPLIYNANPGLMQKMSEIYKYTQPGMMNPAMMNPVMNAGGGAGGASGLQYEPPWQRQHQQQQQMRLQQLMQHQNQMSAKFYAGGLGSRDPIAMALQQQRAREMLMGGAPPPPGGPPPGRPRGRPPLQPRHPTTSQDVVNLDSD